MSVDRLFLGLDSSTQGLKATVVTENLTVSYEATINYDQDLPQFETNGGVHRDSDGQTVTSPPLMWVGALDLLLEKMKDENVPVGRIAAISGSGQQHGSVWLAKGAKSRLQRLDVQSTLILQLVGIFSLENSPTWMYSSTAEQCQDLEQIMGGAQALADLTGSRAYVRFTGNQIAKIHQRQAEAYASTEHISLVSSFMASLLVGDVAPIDASDGSGMNLMDIWSMQWSGDALRATAPALKEKLGPVVPSHSVVGNVHPYYVERYGFSPGCRVIAFSGDNPNSLAGLRLQSLGDLAISMGTSDTIFASLENPKPSGMEGHIFANPITPGAFMAMIVRQNGSLARERVRDDVSGGDWDTFDGLLDGTPPGNGGKIGMYVLEPEITPPITRTGIYRFDAEDRQVDSFNKAEDVRAIIEGQFLSMRLHAEGIGIKPSRLIATGGASVNTSILKVVANVFGKPVYVAERADSASLGAAYRAQHGLACEEASQFISFANLMGSAAPFAEAAVPDMSAHEAYEKVKDRFRRLEQSLL